MEVLVTGATGFVGSHLVDALVADGHAVRAMSRHPDEYEGGGRPVAGDIGDPTSLAAALDGVDVAYYLVHSLGDHDFEAKDAAGARNFATAARSAGAGRIVYLSGLGDDDPSKLSPHLRSRRVVESILAESGVPVTVLRAAIVIGDGGISWEITRQLVKNLPIMVAPRWVSTKTQPISLDDTVRYLVAVSDHPGVEGRVLEIGGPEAMTYADMLRRAAKARTGRELPILVLPLLTPRLSSLWISLVTDVDTTTARNLIESMDTEVVVGERSIADVVPGDLLDYETAVERATAARDERERDAARRRSAGAS